MDALLTINAGSQLADAIVPAKTPQKHDQQFGKVLNKKRQEQHQSEKPAAEKCSKSVQHSEQKETVVCQQSTDTQQQPTEPVEVETKVVSEAKEVVPCVIEDAVQPLAPDSTEEAVVITPVEDGVEENVSTTRTDIADLLEVMVDDEAGEETSKTTDTTEELQAAEVPLQFIETAVVAPVVAEQVVVDKPDLQQQEVPTLAPVEVKPVQQQTAEAVVVALDGEEEVFSTPQIFTSAADDDSVTSENVVDEEVDPRFAGLLKPRNEKSATQPLTPIKDSAQLHGGQKADLQTEEAFIALDEGGEQKPMLETSQLSGLSAKQMLDQLVQPGQHHQGQGQVHIQGFEAAKGLPQAPMVQLSNGYQIPESQIFDQVVTQISGSVNGESGRMVLRLQPAELGSLKLELKIEGDRVQAHLHAQTHQVQDVLERNLPQLRSALAEQGLKIDQFLVNVDQRQAEGQFEGQAQYQQQGSERHSDWNQQDHGNEEQMIPLAHLMQNGGGGISLHV